MKLIEIIKKNGMLLVAGLAVIGFSSFKMIERIKKPSNKSTVTVYFKGNPLNATQVADESFWSEDNPPLTCPNGTQKACSMDVQDSDLNPSTGELDPAKISLNASGNSTTGYVPVKSGGSGSTPIIHNRD